MSALLRRLVYRAIDNLLLRGTRRQQVLLLLFLKVLLHQPLLLNLLRAKLRLIFAALHVSIHVRKAESTFVRLSIVATAVSYCPRRVN